MTRHIREWRLVLREAQAPVTWRTWWRMVRGLTQWTVSAREFRRRARVCVGCPLYDRELRRCQGPWIGGQPTGCGCYLPWLLRVKRPYPKGCWGREAYGPGFGWGVEKRALAA